MTKPDDLVLDVEQIKKLLPHRAPLLFRGAADRHRARRKRHRLEGGVVQRAPFSGPFSGLCGDAGRADRGGDGPDRGRAGGAFARAAPRDKRIVYFMTIEKARFRKPVRPGDLLRMPVKALRRRGPVWRFMGQAYVGDTLCAEAEFSAMIREDQQDGDGESIRRRWLKTARVSARTSRSAPSACRPVRRAGEGVRLLSHVGRHGHHRDRRAHGDPSARGAGRRGPDPRQ